VDVNVGKPRMFQLPKHTTFGKHSHLQGIAITSVENKILKFLYFTMGCRIDQHFVPVAFVDAVLVQFRKVLYSLA
jgi:hypothetical protein